MYTLIYNILAYNKIVNVHDYVEYGLGKVSSVSKELGLRFWQV